MIQNAVKMLLNIGEQLTNELDTEQLAAATSYTDALDHPLSSDDINALLPLLPDDGDTASGINWTILHAIEASPEWPMWEALKDERNEWVQILLSRLANVGEKPPTN